MALSIHSLMSFFVCSRYLKQTNMIRSAPQIQFKCQAKIDQLPETCSLNANSIQTIQRLISLSAFIRNLSCNLCNTFFVYFEISTLSTDLILPIAVVFATICLYILPSADLIKKLAWLIDSLICENSHSFRWNQRFFVQQSVHIDLQHRLSKQAGSPENRNKGFPFSQYCTNLSRSCDETIKNDACENMDAQTGRMVHSRVKLTVSIVVLANCYDNN